MELRHEEIGSDQVVEDIKRRQIYPRGPYRVGDVVNQLLARRGYVQQQAQDEIQSIWNDIVGAQLAAQTRIGRIRRGVLDVFVSNSTLLQELSFRKAELLRALEQPFGGAAIKEIRLRIGQW